MGHSDLAGLGLQSSPQPFGIDPENVVLNAIDEHDRNQVPVALGQFRIVEQAQFLPVHIGFRAHDLDNLPGNVAEVTARLAHQDDSAWLVRRGHAPPSRKARRATLPVVARGSSVTMSRMAGRLNRANRCAAWSRIATGVARSPGRRTTHAFTVSPVSGCETPTTAASVSYTHLTLPTILRV